MCDIVFVMDESLSMNKNRNYYLQALNCIVDIQKQKNPFTKFTFLKFNTRIEFLCQDILIKDVPIITSEHYTPSGVTALYDAVGISIKYKMQNPAKKVLFIILTDGEDNSSQKFTRYQLFERIGHLAENGWGFIYIGANQNAKITGRELGIDTCVTYSESRTSIGKVVDVCSVAIDNYNGVAQKVMPDDVSDLFGKMKI